VTVAVFPVIEEKELVIPDSDIEWEAVHGSGAGGQNKNRRATMIRMKHLPTGITVVCQKERDRERNRRTALRELRARVHFRHAREREQQGLDARRKMVGTGMRGDKIRTVRLQDGTVRDHRTGRRTSVTRYLAGHVEDVA
jgi:peptide chain release factor 1